MVDFISLCCTLPHIGTRPRDRMNLVHLDLDGETLLIHWKRYHETQKLTPNIKTNAFVLSILKFIFVRARGAFGLLRRD